MASHSDCVRALSLDMKNRSGGPLNRSDRHFLQRHRASCEACCIEAQALEMIGEDDGAGGMTELDELATHRLAEQLVAEAETAQPLAATEKMRPMLSAQWKWAIVASAAVALIALVLTIDWHLEAPIASQLKAKQVEDAPAENPHLPTVHVLKGELAFGSDSVRRGESRGAGERFEALHGPAVIGLSSTVTVSMVEKTSLLLSEPEGRCEIALLRGDIIVAVPPAPGRRPITVTTEYGLVEVKGTVFNVQVVDSGAIVKVLRGAVMARQAAQTAAVMVGQGQGVVLGPEPRVWHLTRQELNPLRTRIAELGALGVDPIVLETVIVNNAEQISTGQPRSTGSGASPQPNGSRPSARRSAKALKLLAQKERRANHWQAAADAYANLIAQYPHSSEAEVALVSLGQLALEKLDRPAQALVHFERYRARRPSGVLAQEAHYGKVLALKRLGRTGLERQAIELFLERFPSALQVPSLEKRLNEIQATAAGQKAD